MKLIYYPDTDALYSEQPSADSQEIAEGIMLDSDVSGNLVGIDIDNARIRDAIRAERDALRCSLLAPAR